jgi:uncharacterized integral membrane protein
MRGALRFLGWSIFAFFAVLAGLAMVENRDSIALHFLGWHTAELPVFWWLVVAFLIGCVTGWLVGGVGAVRARVGARKTQRELERSRVALETLKTSSVDRAG